MRHDVDAEIASLLARCLNREPKHRPSAADMVRALSSDPSGASSAHLAIGSGGVEETADFQQLMKRRVPQVVLITGGAGLALMSLMNELTADQELLPDVLYNLTLPFVACGVASATILAWFHGEAGKQKTNVLEWILLSVIGVVWLSVSAWIVLGS